MKAKKRRKRPRKHKREELTYAGAGVDRARRKAAKKFDLFKAGAAKETPFNTLYLLEKAGKFFVLSADGVGTKVLLSQLANHHSTIGIDGVAMVVNDCIRCGAVPKALVDVIDVARSEPALLKEIAKGIASGARQAGCMVCGGETADVAELVSGVSGNPYNLNFSCFGEVEEKKIVWGNGVKPGDAVIGLKSSGIHSNGLSLARKILFKKWGGYYDAFQVVQGFEKPLVHEVLTPTRIYVKPVLEVMRGFDVKAAVHVTGDAFLKFKKLTRFSGVGFEFHNFLPHPIFKLVQSTALKLGKHLSDEEMFKTFNMGWGFCLVAEKNRVDPIVDLLERRGVEAQEIGVATKQKAIVVSRKGKKMVLN